MNLGPLRRLAGITVSLASELVINLANELIINLRD